MQYNEEGLNFASVVAIDVGYRNFAVCAVDTHHWDDPHHFVAEDLWPRRVDRKVVPTRDDCVEIALLWMQRNRALLQAADAIVLESQMRVPFVIMNTVIQAAYFDKTHVVHPQTVGAFWRLPRTRELKKAAGVRTALLNDVPLVRANGGKLDDMADAWLMAVYWLVQIGALGEEQLLREQRG